jgi:hypothetical protein
MDMLSSCMLFSILRKFFLKVHTTLFCSMKQAMWKPMKSQYLESVATVALLVVFVFSYGSRCYADSSVFAPTWLKKGVYAKYTYSSGTAILPTNTSKMSRYEIVDFVDGVFRWECIDLNENTSKLKFSLSFIATERSGQPLEENETIQLSTEVYVNIFSRALYLQNGSLIGTTHLWLPANPAPNTDIVMWDVPPDKVTINPTGTGNGMTPQGRQPAFIISSWANGTIDGKAVSFHGMWDLDTGVMISEGKSREPAFTALDLKEWVGKTMMFADTNIDLGPGDNSLDLRTIITIIAVPVAFVTIFVAVYMRRRKKR